MKNKNGCKIITERKTGISKSRALTLAAVLALALPGAAAKAQNTSNPIPGVDIVVKKNPGDISVTLPIDASGRFSLRLTAPGQYTISTACRLPAGCAPHTLSFDASATPGADGTRAIAILIGLLLPAQEAGAMSYDFTVDDRPVVLGGQFPSTAGIRVAAGDVDGDGVREASQPGAAFKIADNESPRPTDRVLAGAPSTDTPIGLESDSGSVKASTRTDGHGAFQFTRLPPGKYNLFIAGQPARSFTVGARGTISGKLKHGGSGTHDITFDTVLTTLGGNRLDGAAGDPLTGFGSGNAFGFGSGPAGGMSPGGAMGPGNPMLPGGAMGGAGMGKR